MPIQDLLAVCSPPARVVDRPSLEQWAALEQQVGRALPPDYKALLDLFGSGAFGSYEEGGAFFDLIFTLSPGCTRDDLDAFALMLDLSEVIAEMKRQWPGDVPYPVWPEPGGLLYLGGTTTTHCIYWRTDGPPDTWTVAICDRPCEAWFHWEGDLTSFLAAMVTRRVPEWIIEGPSRFPLVFEDLDTLHTVQLA